MIRPTTLLSGALAALCLLIGLGCVGNTATSTSGTALYVFDAGSSSSNRLLVWDDLETLHSATATSATRSIQSSLLDDVQTLGWGGMCIDRNLERMWLVSQTGKVVRLDSIKSLSGSISTTYIRSFQLGTEDSDYLSNGKFGQAAVDPSTHTLYVTETNSTTGRIWVIANPSQYAEGGSVTPVTVRASGDAYGYGVAVGSGSALYGFFSGGSSITNDDTTYVGARLRLGSSSGFSSSSQVLIGSATLLAKYGSLAADTSNDLIYVCRHNTDSGTTIAPILAFTASQCASGFNLSPTLTLGSTGTQGSLRIIAHAGIKEWLVAAESNDLEGGNRLWLYKAPRTGPSGVAVDLDSTVVIRGIALDGSN